ncbi:MAG TPA: carbon-nitrogen hydrolase family protein [Chthonomonadaceae bacterium]|nr:carbon-nitrogen hydrolase family protein [Chthonomonadaceae bacterium]
MKIALIQMNSRIGARDENVNRACEFISSAAQEGAQLIVLPEFFNYEYFPQYRDYRYMDYAETQEGVTTTRMREAARENQVWLVSTIFELERPGLYYDTAMLIAPTGEIIGKYRKVHPAALLSLEKIYFRGGSSFPVFRVGEWTIGFSICYDNLFPESCRCLAIRGAELIIAPYATPIDDPWENFLTTRALENGVFLAACNHVGQEGEWRMSGKSMLISPYGKILHQASGTEEQVIVAEIDREQVIDARRRFPLFRDRRPDVYGVIAQPMEALFDVGPKPEEGPA